MSDNRFFRAACALSLTAGAAGSALYVSAFTSYYDTAIRHYDAVPVLYAFAALFILSVLLCAAASLSLRGRLCITNDVPCTFETFILWLTAFLFISFGAATMMSPSDASTLPAVPAICARLLPILSVLSAFSFVFSISSRLRGTAWHAASSLVPLFWTAALLFRYYYDLSEMVLNDPETSMTSLCIACAMLFFLAEARRAFAFLTPAFASFCYTAAASMTGFISISRIVLRIISDHSTPSLNENIAFAAIGLVSLARLYSLNRNMPSPASAEGATFIESEMAGEVEDD